MTDIILPIFDRLPLLEVCWKYLTKNTDLSKHKVILIDHSQDQNINAWTAGRTEATVVLDNCTSHAAACNIGIQKATSDYLVILHPDCFVTEGWIDKLVGRMQETNEEEVAVSMPLTSLTMDKHICTEKRKPFGKLRGRAKMTPEGIEQTLAQLYPEGFEQYAKGRNSTVFRNYRHPVIFCTAFRRDMFARVGLFDTDFVPRGYEEAEWFLRAERIGYECWLNEAVYVHHWGGTSLGLTEAYVTRFKAMLSDKENAFYRP